MGLDLLRLFRPALAVASSWPVTRPFLVAVPLQLDHAMPRMEFSGRTGVRPRAKIYSLNGHAPGRDHHGLAKFVLFAGAGVKTGQVVGTTGSHGERHVGRPYTPQNVRATLYAVLGIDPALTLPEHTGQHVYLPDERRKIEELLEPPGRGFTAGPYCGYWAIPCDCRTMR
jgi:Protein of unknown function (DUF1501)